MAEKIVLCVFLGSGALVCLCFCRKPRDSDNGPSEDLIAFRERRGPSEPRNTPSGEREAGEREADRRRRRDLARRRLSSMKITPGAADVGALSAVLSAPAAERRASGCSASGGTTGSRTPTSWSWRSVLSIRSLGRLSKSECAICLCPYQSGEVVAWSKAEECTHIFHRECIVEWLVQHDDCPLCRVKMMNFDPEDVSEDDSAAPASVTAEEQAQNNDSSL